MLLRKAIRIMMEIKKITDRISFIPEIREPLSAEVFLIQGDEYLYIFDVGFSDEVTEYLNNIQQKKRVVISHFHRDHLGNIKKTQYDEIYIGNYTKKYLEGSEVKIVTEPVKIHDGVDITIYPMPSSHSKGSLAVLCEDILFMGDSAYPEPKDDKDFYNVTLLKEQHDFLESLAASFVINSHEDGRKRKIEVEKRLLMMHYAKRKPGEAYIEV